jgi:peroxidase
VLRFFLQPPTPPDALFLCGKFQGEFYGSEKRQGSQEARSARIAAIGIVTKRSTGTPKAAPPGTLRGRTPKKTERNFYMNARQFGWLLILVLSSLFSAPNLGASSDSHRSSVELTWLRVFRNSPVTQRDVFNAFHSSGTSPVASALPGPLVTASPPAVYPDEFRTIGGRGNAVRDLGRAGMIDLRNTTIGYGDGHGTPAGADRLGARDISNIVLAQTDSIPNSQPISGFVWNWGNIVDHDMVLTRVSNPAELFDIPIPTCDPVFDPNCRGGNVLHFNRSNHIDTSGIREQINANTSFVDASFVYGSDVARSLALRTLDGTGHLETGDNNLLPFNIDRLPNQPTNDPSFFIAGDTRSNENLALCAMQTLLMREHNYWADIISAGDPTLDDEGIYLRARAIVGAEIQLITYRDFIPILLGADALPPYISYNPFVDPRVSLAFSTAAFRIGHTLLPPVLMRLNARNRSIGDIALEGSLFQPQLITGIGIEPYLRGLANQIPQEADGYMIDSVRNFTAGGTPAGFDLGALNIQRGRDHGLPGYNQVRIDFGLTPKGTFAEMTSNLELQARLAAAYTSPDDLDVWVGGLVEDHVNGGLVGETFATIFKDQFQRSRDGDRFWYESYLDADSLALVQQQTLGIIIKRNTTIGDEMQDEVFHVPPVP